MPEDIGKLQVSLPKWAGKEVHTCWVLKLADIGETWLCVESTTPDFQLLTTVIIILWDFHCLPDQPPDLYLKNTLFRLLVGMPCHTSFHFVVWKVVFATIEPYCFSFCFYFSTIVSTIVSSYPWKLYYFEVNVSYRWNPGSYSVDGAIDLPLYMVECKSWSISPLHQGHWMWVHSTVLHPRKAAHPLH